MRYALVAWLCAVGWVGPTSQDSPQTRVVAFGDPQDAAFAAEWSASRAHLHGAQFDAQSVAPPRKATRASLARSLAEREPGLVAVFWWVPTTEGLRLFAFVPQTGAYLRREIPIAKGEEAAAIESLALIIATTAEALRFGEAVAMLEASVEELEAAEAQLDGEEPEPELELEPEPEPEPSTAPASRDEKRRVTRWVSVHYFGEVVASEAWWQSGFGLRAGLGPRPHLGVQLGYSYSPRLSFELAPAEGVGRSDRHTFETLIAYRTKLHPRVELSAGGGPQLELWPWRANDVGGLRPHLRALFEATFRIRLSEHWYLPCTFFSAVSTSSLDFVVCADGGSECAGDARRVVFSPFGVRAGVRAGLGARF